MLLANNQNSRLSSIRKSMRLHSFHLPSLTSLGIPILKYSTPVLKVLCITCLIICRSHRNPLRCHSHPPFIFLSVILNVFGALDRMRLHESQSSSSPGEGGQHCEGTRGEALDLVPPPSRKIPTPSAGFFQYCWLFFEQGMGYSRTLHYIQKASYPQLAG